MPLPTLTSLQFLILGALLGGEKSGRAIRQNLIDQGTRRTAPAFYQLMARLEDSRFVELRYEKKTVQGQTVTENWYKITGVGARAWHETRDFYLNAAVPEGWQGGGAHA
jgi:DNA-binding PadR family transcriptional regulator